MSTLALPQIAPPPSSRYVAYAYAYPHKTAYRHIDPAIPLSDAWAAEDKSSLFLYAHLPFCEMRCGFCNLFTLAHPQEDLVSSYLRTLEIEATHAAGAVGPATITRIAIGGGTPTFLDPSPLDRFFDLLQLTFAAALGKIPLSIETSPRTASLEKMQLLQRRGATRVSIGVQSFIESEVAAAGRAQKNTDVHGALHNIRAAGIPTLNLDLIYGLPSQTVQTFLHSIHVALSHHPEELYLYPLYVRPLTGMSRRDLHDDDTRVDSYNAGRDMLLAEGYEQVSMRMFRRKNAAVPDAPFYCCQDDGMVGIGCGARSYTTSLHYSREFAVGRESVKSILHDYIHRSPASFDVIDYGCRLNDHEQRRRYVIKSVLRYEGLDIAAYRVRFHSDPLTDVPTLQQLLNDGFLVHAAGKLVPTQEGIDHSDAIGPRLFSDAMQHSMQEFDLK